MKNFATGTMLNLERHHLTDGAPEQVPFFGFMTGTLLSAALWAGIGLAVWVVQ